MFSEIVNEIKNILFNTESDQTILCTTEPLPVIETYGLQLTDLNEKLKDILILPTTVGSGLIVHISKLQKSKIPILNSDITASCDIPAPLKKIETEVTFDIPAVCEDNRMQSKPSFANEKSDATDFRQSLSKMIPSVSQKSLFSSSDSINDSRRSVIYRQNDDVRLSDITKTRRTQHRDNAKLFKTMEKLVYEIEGQAKEIEKYGQKPKRRV